MSLDSTASLPSTGAPAPIGRFFEAWEGSTRAENWPEAVWHAHQLVEFLEVYLASAALAAELSDFSRERLARPPAHNPWPAEVLAGLRSSGGELVEDLRRLAGDELVGLKSELEPLFFEDRFPEAEECQRRAERVRDGVARLNQGVGQFFRRWLHATNPGPHGGLEVHLMRGERRLNLYPFLEIRDDPDTGTLGQWFCFAGAGSRGTSLYRNLHLGNLSQRALGPGAGSEPSRLEQHRPAGVQRAFEEDPQASAPEFILAALRRQLGEADGGYLLVEGGAGLGKTYLARFFSSQGKRGDLYYSLQSDGDADAGLLPFRIDEALRQERATVLPAVEAVRQKLLAQQNPTKRLPSYLQMLSRALEQPVVLLLDGIGRQHSALTEVLPRELPAGISIVLLYDPVDLGGDLAAHFEELALTGGRVSLKPDTEPYRELVRRVFGDQGRQTTLLEARIIRHGRESGLWREGPPPEQPIVLSFLRAVEGRVGAGAWTRHYLGLLALLGAAREPLPLGWIADWLGGTRTLLAVCGRLGPLLRGDGDSLELAHSQFLAYVEEEQSRSLSSAGKCLAHFGAREVGQGSPTLTHLRWVVTTGEPALLRRCLTDERWAEKLWSLLAESGCSTLQVALQWRRAVAGLAARDANLRVQLARIAREVGRHCLEQADTERAASELDQVVEILGELVRFGEAGGPLTGELAGAHLRRSALHVERANFQQARADARRAHELYDRKAGSSEEGRARALHLEGVALEALGEFEPALGCLTRAVDSCPSSQELPRWQRQLAGVRHQLGDLEGAAEDLERALEALQVGGAVEERALCLARRAQVRDEQGEAASATEDARAACGLLERLVETDRRLDLRAQWADAQRILGFLIFGDRELSLGVDLYRRLVEEAEVRQRPALALTLGSRGLVRARTAPSEALQDYGETLDLLSRLVEEERRLGLRGELARVRNNRGMCLLEGGDFDEAYRDFDGAVEHFQMLAVRQGASEFLPELGLALFNRAAALRELGRFDEACQDYDRCLERLSEACDSGEVADPDLASAYANRGFARLAAGHTDRALEDYSQAIELYQGLEGAELELAVVLNNRGEARVQQGRRSEALDDYDAAQEQLKRLSEVDIDLARVLNNRAAVLLELDRASDARETLLGSVELNDGGALDKAAAWSLLARCSEELGELERAREEYQTAVERFRPLSEARLELGHACHRLARVCESLQLLKEATTWLSEAGVALSGDPEALAEVELTRASVLIGLGRYEEAEVAACRGHELGRDLAVEARSRYHRGRAGELQADRDGARGHYDQAVSLYVRLVEEQSRYELCPALAAAYRRRGAVAESSEGALDDYGWSIELLRELVHHQGRGDLREDLAGVYRERAGIHACAGTRESQDTDLKEAVVLYNALLREGQPERAEVLADSCVKLARLRRQSGDLSAARNLCQRAIRTLTEFPEPVPRGMAAALSEAARVAEAQREYLRALELRNQAVEALDELVRVHGYKEREGDLLEARRCRSRLLESLGKLEEALEDLDLAAAGYRRWADGASLAVTLADKAAILGRLARHQEAEETFDKAVKAASDDASRSEVYCRRGEFLALCGDSEQAFEQVSKAVELLEETAGGRLGRALYRRGEILRQAASYDRALRDYDRAVRFLTSNGDQADERRLLAGVRLGRGLCLVRIGKTGDGLSELEEAVERLTTLSEEEDSGVIREQLASAYFERARALLDADPIMALYSIRNTIGIYRAVTAREGEAGQREVLAEAYMFRARLLEGMDKAQQAREDFELAASIYTALIEAEGRDDLETRRQDCLSALKQ